MLELNAQRMAWFQSGLFFALLVLGFFILLFSSSKFWETGRWKLGLLFAAPGALVLARYMSLYPSASAEPMLLAAYGLLPAFFIAFPLLWMVAREYLTLEGTLKAIVSILLIFAGTLGWNAYQTGICGDWQPDFSWARCATPTWLR